MFVKISGIVFVFCNIKNKYINFKYILQGKNCLYLTLIALMYLTNFK